VCGQNPFESLVWIHPFQFAKAQRIHFSVQECPMRFYPSYHSLEIFRQWSLRWAHCLFDVLGKRKLFLTSCVGPWTWIQPSTHEPILCGWEYFWHSLGSPFFLNGILWRFLDIDFVKICNVLKILNKKGCDMSTKHFYIGRILHVRIKYGVLIRGRVRMFFGKIDPKWNFKWQCSKDSVVGHSLQVQQSW
jgi:hypothetical protein